MALAAALGVALGACDEGPVQPQAEVVPGEYIVVFKDHVPFSELAERGRALATAYGGELIKTFEPVLRGYHHARLPDAAVDALRRHPDVKYVEPNRLIRVGTHDAPR